MYWEPWTLPRGKWYMLYCGPWTFPTGRACTIVSPGTSPVRIKIYISSQSLKNYPNTPFLNCCNFFDNICKNKENIVENIPAANPPNPACGGRMENG